MQYTIWVHHNSRSAKAAGFVGGEWSMSRELFVIEVHGSNWTLDTQAWDALNAQYRAKHPGETRPLAGRSYIRNCRASFRGPK
jgi:hypothetical protein